MGMGMGKRSMSVTRKITIIMYSVLAVSLSNKRCYGLESPDYTLVYSESDLEIRLYKASTWMTAPVPHITSFRKATRDGFRRLFEYIEGGNWNNSEVSMTVPVVTSIVPEEAGSLDSSAYFVHFYLPNKFQASPPIPLPELNLEPDSWTSHCVAVRKFSGFAKDNNIVKEAEKLASSLSQSPWANSSSSDGPYAYSIAQYNSPFRLIGRVNEVWIDVDGSVSDGCKTDLISTF